MTPSHPHPRSAMPVVEQALLGLLVLGGIAILSLPAARTAGGAFGWMPLWLTLLPATALATAVALRWTRETTEAAASSRLRRRRQAVESGTSPRRGSGMALRRRLPRAA